MYRLSFDDLSSKSGQYDICRQWWTMEFCIQVDIHREKNCSWFAERSQGSPGLNRASRWIDPGTINNLLQHVKVVKNLDASAARCRCYTPSCKVLAGWKRVIYVLKSEGKYNFWHIRFWQILAEGAWKGQMVFHLFSGPEWKFLRTCCLLDSEIFILDIFAVTGWCWFIHYAKFWVLSGVGLNEFNWWG